MRLAGYDRSLGELAISYMEAECDRAEEFDENRQTVIKAINSNACLTYAKGRTLDPADGDLYDRISGIQKKIMVAHLAGDDKTILALVKKACDDEIDSVVDLIWG